MACGKIHFVPTNWSSRALVNIKLRVYAHEYAYFASCIKERDVLVRVLLQFVDHIRMCYDHQPPVGCCDFEDARGIFVLYVESHYEHSSFWNTPMMMYLIISLLQ